MGKTAPENSVRKTVSEFFNSIDQERPSTAVTGQEYAITTMRN